MDSGKHTFEWFETYLAGKMNPSEQIEFERELETDSALREEFELHKATKTLIRETGREELKKKLDSRFEDAVKAMDQPERPWYQLPAMRWAAVILILAVVGIGYWLNTRKTGSERLFAQYFEPVPLSGYRDIPQTSFQTDSLIYFYEKENYQAFIGYMKGLPADTTRQLLADNPRLSLYYASSLLAENQRDAAAVLRPHLDNQQFRDQMEWYLMLTYLRENNRDSVQYFLDIITGDSLHYKFREASAIKKSEAP